MKTLFIDTHLSDIIVFLYEDGKVVKSTMSDDKIIVEVPNTLKNDYIPLGMATLIVIGGGIVIYGTFKKKKQNKK